MSLNISSNQASSIANRSLKMADMDMTSSLRKLSSGLAVERFADNVAAGAIGSRIKSQLSALKTVSTNAQQGVAVFQIAEGTLSRVYDILVRLKSLASQAGSSQLSSVERGMLNTEYAAMLSEIDRLTANTTFNGNTLVNANQSAGAITGFGTAAGVRNIAIGGLSSVAANGLVLEFATGSASNIFYATNGGRYYRGTLETTLESGGTGGTNLVSGTAVRLFRVDSSGTSTAASQVAGDNSYIVLTLDQSFNPNAAIGSASGNVGVNSASATGLSTFAFKVGISGVSSNDEISLGIRGVNTYALGLRNASDTTGALDSNITTQVRADSAAAAVTIAIDLVLNSRAEVGAVQNRLESAQNNIATILENLEAARASYLDVDVATEMANFTSKQILVQAGISMLAQANQVPQSLLKLFQQ
ncbi:MAG: flagellin [Dongiaceae bacterium]